MPRNVGTNTLGMLIVFTMLLWTTACQKTEPANTNSSTAPVNSSSTALNSPSPAASVPAPSPETPSSTVISLATPTDTYKTGYAARKNKDVATLKRVMSKDALAFLADMGSVEKKSLDDLLKELTEKPQAPTPDVRNEKITGNRATLEYLNEKGEWSTMDFTKDGDEWKIDLPKGP